MSNNPTSQHGPRHVWRFFRCGGVNQVTIRNGADISNLKHLDLKLWVALAMPTRGIDFDPRTLEFIDTDNDNRIRPPEVIDAISWAESAFVDLDVLCKGGDSVSVSGIRDEAMRTAAQRILSNLGKKDAPSISLGDIESRAKEFTQTRLNGDGVVPVDDAEDEITRKDIGNVIIAVGGVTDRSGKPGVDQSTLDRFFAEAQAYSDWHQKGEADDQVLPLGEKTADAQAALKAVEAKVDDYFVRGRLAAFDERAVTALNRPESEYLALTTQNLGPAIPEAAGFPLAHVEADKPLPLGEGLNPAWAAAMRAFVRDAVTPLLGAGKTTLSEADWGELKSKLAAYSAWQAAKPVTGADKLGIKVVRDVLAGDARERITNLIAADAALAPEYDQIVSIEKLVRFQRDLVTLLKNFVNFAEFYSRRGAIFQCGTLFLDARSCHLCVNVIDAATHATLAGLAGAYLAYCDCTRVGFPKRTIAAVFSDGDQDNLMVGRNGVFYDRKGLDWDATIVKVVANPISLREAFWSPYKKLLRLIEEMAAKRAAAADAAADKKLAGATTGVTSADNSKPAEPKKIDVGTVAALGVAVGAIGAAITALATGILKLAWWQVPLLFLGIILLISLPAMIIAWIKLRRRNLGPILDANGWAINTRARLNVPFGASLTDVAELPENSERSLEDPFAEKKTPWALIIFILVLLAAAIWIRVDHNRRGHYFWEQSSDQTDSDVNPAEVNMNVAAGTTSSN